MNEHQTESVLCLQYLELWKVLVYYRCLIFLLLITTCTQVTVFEVLTSVLMV